MNGAKNLIETSSLKISVYPNKYPVLGIFKKDELLTLASNPESQFTTSYIGLQTTLLCPPFLITLTSF
jgi:hypothetical protein